MVVGWHGAGFTGNGESIFKAKSDVELNGRDVYIFTGSIDMGQGLDSVFPAIVADTLGLPIERVHMGPHDTAQVPNSGPTAASRSTMVVGAVVKKAAENLIEALKAEIGASDGETFAQMVDRRQNTAPLRVRAQYPGDSAVWDRDLYRGDAYPDYAWISVLVDLDVDLDTGEILFRRLFQSADAGVCLNPQSVRGQFEGGALQALGWSHSEHVIVGQNGAMRNNHLTDYIIPTSLDAPDMSVDLKNIPFESGPFGAKGMGEMPHDCPAAAVAQAIEDATGIVLDELPMNPEAIVAKLLARSEKE
jgi:CO/xanthine dehydrogenase Mo-binding subunit